MNKKALLFLSSVLTATALAVSFITIKHDGAMKAESHQNTYSLTLNSSNSTYLPSNKGSGQSNDSNSPRTSNNNPITMAYANASRVTGYVCALYPNSGYLANVADLTGLYSITVNFRNGACQLSYGNSFNNYSDTIAIESGIRYEINNLSHFKLTMTGNSTTYISSINIEYTCGGHFPSNPVLDHIHNGYHYLAKEATETKAGNREFYTCNECCYVSLVKEDNGEYIDTFLTYELDSNHVAYIAPLYNLNNDLLKEPAQFDYPIAINIEVPSQNYNADNTGNTDATYHIQQALYYVYNLGGGTVYVSSGKYLLSGQLTIPNRVTLVGDFKGPDSNDYGTVFLCNKSYSGSSIQNDAQIVLQSNAGINGITFYYPNQNINSVTEYGYTIYTYNNDTANMANLFFINSYKGIAINNPTSGSGELANIENVYGTFLNTGISAYCQSDVGYWNNINMSPSYYTNAIAEYKCNSSATLTRYIRDHLTALELGDLDDFSFNKINIDNAHCGILFSKDSVRELQAFWGFLNNVNLIDCVTGIYAQKLFSSGSALFTHSKLGTIVNISNYGMIKLAKCQYDDILGSGKTIIEPGSEDYELPPSYDETNQYSIPSYLYYVDFLDDTGATDVSALLQVELNRVYTGGLFVLKNGTYRLDNPITVPNNVMLASFANSYSRTRSEETKNELVKFISYSNDACVKLSNYSGINGIRIYNAYKDIDTAKTKLDNSQSDSFVAVKGIGNNCFAINTETSFTFTGFDFSSVSNHYIKYCYGSTYETFIKAGASGKIIASLSNVNYLSRTCLGTYAVTNNTAINKYLLFETDRTTLDYVRNITRTYSTMININNSSNELVLNCFSYGLKCLINSTNSTLLAVNTSLDYLLDNNYLYIINGGDATIVNTFRVFGQAFNLISGHLKIYGRYDFTKKREISFDSNYQNIDEEELLPSNYTENVLSTCETNTNVSGASRSSTQKHSGSYSWKASSTVNPAVSYTFNKNISLYMASGLLRFYLYCSNISNKGSGATVELTSSGTCDDQEIFFNIDNQIKQNGWNEILIELSAKEQGSTSEFNPSSCNYFRFFTLNASCNYYVDDISFLCDPEIANALTINDCENTTSTNGVSTSSFSAHGDYCWAPSDSVNTVFACTFNSKNITSYMSSGYLSLYFYCADTTKLGDILVVELTSSGQCDNQEITNVITNYVTKDGWNHIKVPLSTFYAGSETSFNSAQCNFFRLYTLNTSCDLYVDHIQLIY